MGHRADVRVRMEADTGGCGRKPGRTGSHRSHGSQKVLEGL